MSVGLLDPGFVRELEALRRMLSVRVASGASGEQVARRRGGSTEFSEHRPYAPGDDLRRVDWAAYARTGEPVVKVFRAEEDVLVRLAVDTSASLAGDKLDRALRVAAAVGYMALAGAERVQVIPFAGTATLRARPVRGRSGLPDLLHTLAGVTAGGTTDLGAAVDAAVAHGRPGLLVVVSDFLDPAGCARPLRRARAAGHDLALVQVLRRDEMDPRLDGDLVLEDSETGETVDLTADPDVLAAYRARLAALVDDLRAFARAHRASYARTVTDERLEDAVRRVVERRVDPGCAA